ncbi:MAG: 4Fe-4S binding protein [Firmicutes bacterium]|nr:4Fe-4S binding protein [Bacillota bacterium]MBQ6662233.1 4Fe-4S binding protein [Bacillota bacterium]MCR4710736.1 4Fe-4S binding protein [Clostridia bacterium]
MKTKTKELILESAWCKGCGICVAFCPKNALELVGEKARLKTPNECILCGQCEMRCPDYAIYLKEVSL